MRCKCHFSFDVSENLSETPAIRPKSVWKSPKDHVSLKVHLSRLEKDFFLSKINQPIQNDLSEE